MNSRFICYVLIAPFALNASINGPIIKSCCQTISEISFQPKNSTWNENGDADADTAITFSSSRHKILNLLPHNPFYLYI